MTTLALGAFLAVGVGLSLGLLGGGGSILTLPILLYVLGQPEQEAVPTSLVVVGVTSGPILQTMASRRSVSNIDCRRVISGFNA